MMKKRWSYVLLCFYVNIATATIIPIGTDNNTLYYKIGGSEGFSLPATSNTDTIHLNTNTNLGLGLSCSAFNPALSISNSINDLKDSAENLTRDIVTNATGSLIMMPLYELAKTNPTLYALLNNQLLSANHKLELSTKSCEAVKEQINRGENPYQEWGKIAVNDQWKKQLSFAAIGNADINQAKKDIDARPGEEGVAWSKGEKSSDGSLHAGGKGQPPVYVIADTVKAGYNAMQNRDLQSDEPGTGNLIHDFPTPQSAMDWITSVVGDQRITTCNDGECQKNQGSVVGHGLLPRVMSCESDRDNCVTTMSTHLTALVRGHDAETAQTMERVSAGGIAISPDVIASIRSLEPREQAIIINKLAQEIAVQRVIDKALTARTILATGAQVPVIAANHPAQVLIHRAMAHLDEDIRSLVFEHQIRKQMMSETLSQVLAYSTHQQRELLQAAPVTSTQPLMNDGAKETK
jgi:integrating conjugative element protein (TIGR03755 family)